MDFLVTAPCLDRVFEPPSPVHPSHELKFLGVHWKCKSCAAQFSVRTRKVTRKLESICSRKSKPSSPPLLDVVSSAAVSRPKVKVAPKPKPKPKGLVQTKLSF